MYAPLASVINLGLSLKLLLDVNGIQCSFKEFGIDVNERIFKTLYSGGFCVSDKVDSYKMFGDGIVMADSPEDFRTKIDHYLANPAEKIKIVETGKKYVTENHTGFHRAAQIMDAFDLTSLSTRIMKDYNVTV